MKIEYLKGDATEPQGDGVKFIVHIVNNMGVWGKGFVMALSKKWPSTRHKYLQHFDGRRTVQDGILGSIFMVQVTDDIYVVNLFGQSGIYFHKDGTPPIRYDAVEEGLSAMVPMALQTKASIHMPRIGTGLAGGKWKEVEPIINRTLISSGIPVFVYDLQPFSEKE